MRGKPARLPRGARRLLRPQLHAGARICGGSPVLGGLGFEPMPYAEGENYRIDYRPRDPFAVCTVWRRPDLSSEAGARCAAEISEHLRRLAADPVEARALIFDLRTGPPATGPKTEAALGAMFAAWERAGKRIEVVVAEGVQKLQMRRLLASHAPAQGAVFTDLDAAQGIAAQASAAPRTAGK